MKLGWNKTEIICSPPPLPALWLHAKLESALMLKWCLCTVTHRRRCSRMEKRQATATLKKSSLATGNNAEDKISPESGEKFPNPPMSILGAPSSRAADGVSSVTSSWTDEKNKTKKHSAVQRCGSKQQPRTSHPVLWLNHFVSRPITVAPITTRLWLEHFLYFHDCSGWVSLYLNVKRQSVAGVFSEEGVPSMDECIHQTAGDAKRKGSAKSEKTRFPRVHDR